MIYLWLADVDMAIARVRDRVARGGHDVPEEVIRRRYDRSLANFFNLYRPLADSWLMLDNSEPGRPKTIAWRNVGGPIRIAQVSVWNRLQGKYEQVSLTRH